MSQRYKRATVESGNTIIVVRAFREKFKTRAQQ